MSGLLKRSIATLSSIVNVSTGASHPLDEARAQELFLALHDSGEPLSFGAVYSLALANKWHERHAKQLGELAQRVADGVRVRVEHGRGWGEPTVARLRAEIAAEKA